MTLDITFIGSRQQLRIDGSYVGTYDSLEDLETAVTAYRGI